MHSRFNLWLRTPRNVNKTGRNITRLKFTGRMRSRYFVALVIRYSFRGSPQYKRGTLEHPETRSSFTLNHGCVGSIASPVNTITARAGASAQCPESSKTRPQCSFLLLKGRALQGPNSSPNPPFLKSPAREIFNKGSISVLNPSAQELCKVCKHKPDLLVALHV